jgi:hypothetical protein
LLINLYEGYYIQIFFFYLFLRKFNMVSDVLIAKDLAWRAVLVVGKEGWRQNKEGKDNTHRKSSVLKLLSFKERKIIFIDLACTSLHHHARKCFSYSRFSNPNVVQKKYISTDLLLRWVFFFFLWQLENSIMFYIADSMTMIFYLYWGWKLGVELEKAKMCLVLTGGKCIIRNKLSVEFGL